MSNINVVCIDVKLKKEKDLYSLAAMQYFQLLSKYVCLDACQRISITCQQRDITRVSVLFYLLLSFLLPFF